MSRDGGQVQLVKVRLRGIDPSLSGGSAGKMIRHFLACTELTVLFLSDVMKLRSYDSTTK